jgi:hypothetical protein
MPIMVFSAGATACCSSCHLCDERLLFQLLPLLHPLIPQPAAHHDRVVAQQQPERERRQLHGRVGQVGEQARALGEPGLLLVSKIEPIYRIRTPRKHLSLQTNDPCGVPNNDLKRISLSYLMKGLHPYFIKRGTVKGRYPCLPHNWNGVQYNCSFLLRRSPAT